MKSLVESLKETTTVRAKKDLFNGGKCFTEGKEYIINKNIDKRIQLIDATTTNDLGHPHVIGIWWRNFTIID